MDTQEKALCVHFLFWRRTNESHKLFAGHLTVALRGEIDHHSAKDIMRVLGNKIDLYLPRVCVLDFREVTFMDSSGIAIVISCVRRMRQLRGEVILRSVPPQPMKVLKASGIERIATLEDERSLVHES